MHTYINVTHTHTHTHTNTNINTHTHTHTHNVVLEGDGRVLNERVHGLNCKASEFSPAKGACVCV